MTNSRTRSPFSLLAICALVLFGLAPVTQAAKGLPDFTRLVEQYGPAVVNISTTQKRGKGSAMPHGLQIPDIPKDSPFYEFFERFFGEKGEIPQQQLPEEYRSESLGSGLIISGDGYVVTNHHVIQDADKVIVRLSDRREFVAEVVGSDPRSDLALLRIEAANLPVVRIGRSEDLKVGEWVLAIGSPFGFEHSATAGIVSAKGRSLPSDNYVPFIQTDVAINPGNSGGPLFNLDGEVVGVNSQIYSRTGGFMGLSFAIPIDMAMDVVEQIKTSGRVSRGWLGVLIQDVSQELAESFGMDRPRGALVAQVLPDSPAAEAGIRVGDVILGFDGENVEHSSDLPPIVGRTRAGSKVAVEVLRDGRVQALKVTIDELPDDETLQKASGQLQDGRRIERIGLTIEELSPEQREELQVPENGVLVTEVEDGPASRAGIRQGDVILMMNNLQVSDAKALKDMVDGLPAGKTVPLLIHRQGSPLFLALRTEE
ncbi:MAG: DegQ family serine endoprotease [Gammaproteobacteria bacterium]|nr:DegQ family serine endoprotease [Gammaproteobacteria bacterium]